MKYSEDIENRNREEVENELYNAIYELYYIFKNEENDTRVEEIFSDVIAEIEE